MDKALNIIKEEFQGNRVVGLFLYLRVKRGKSVDLKKFKPGISQKKLNDFNKAVEEIRSDKR